MVRVGLTALEHLKIVGGIAVIENGYEEVADLYVLRREEIAEEEPRILERAKAMVPRLWLDRIDALIVYEQGKEIAGTGMDPAVVGRPINKLPNIGPEVASLGVLRLTSHSGGNASGCGMADFISRRLRDAVDEETMVVNSITGMKPFLANIPPTLATDELVVKACIKNAGQIPPSQFKLVAIRNSRTLDEVWMSEAACRAAEDSGRAERIGEYETLEFSPEGDLLLFE